MCKPEKEISTGLLVFRKQDAKTRRRSIILWRIYFELQRFFVPAFEKRKNIQQSVGTTSLWICCGWKVRVLRLGKFGDTSTSVFACCLLFLYMYLVTLRLHLIWSRELFISVAAVCVCVDRPVWSLSRNSKEEQHELERCVCEHEPVWSLSRNSKEEQHELER